MSAENGRTVSHEEEPAAIAGASHPHPDPSPLRDTATILAFTPRQHRTAPLPSVEHSAVAAIKELIASERNVAVQLAERFIRDLTKKRGVR